MKRLTALAAALLLVGACSSDKTSTADTTTTVPATTTTTTPASTTHTTTPTTVAPTTAVPTTQPTTTSEPCPAVGATTRQTSDDPLLSTTAYGVDIRTGRHLCFERLVIEAANGALPGWIVEYVDDPVRLGQSDNFVFIEGSATLSVRLSMWMPTMEGDGYAGPPQVFPTNVDHILELRETENFEAVSIWSIGLDAKYPFVVTHLHSPERLVIDFQVPAGT